MKKILFIAATLLAFVSNSQVSRNRLKLPLYSWIGRQVPTNQYWDSTLASFHNIYNDGAAATATNTMAFINKSGNISQWTNNSGYLTSGTAGALYTPLTRSLTINNNTFDLSATRSWTTNVSATSVKTTSYLAAYWDYVPIDCSTGSFTLQLPATPPDGIVIGYKMIATSSTNSVLIKAGGSDVFNKAAGSTSLSISLLNQGQILQYKALSGIWYVISDNLGLSQLDARYTGTISGGYVPYSGATNSLNLGSNTFSNSAITAYSNGIFALRTTTATSAVNGNMWYDGGLSGNNGFNFYSDDPSNASYLFNFGNSTNFLRYYADHSNNNWLTIRDGSSMMFSTDNATTVSYEMDRSNHVWTVHTATSSIGTAVFRWNSANHTGQTASTELNPFSMASLGVQYNTGALARQRGMRFEQLTVSFVGTSTLTDAANFYVAGPVVAGSNATITNTSGFQVGGMTGTISVGAGSQNAYGLTIFAPTGAINNYAARFLQGRVGIGTSAPTASLDITGDLNVSTTSTVGQSLRFGINNYTNTVVSDIFRTATTVDGVTIRNDNATFGLSIRNGTYKLQGYCDSTVSNPNAQWGTNKGGFNLYANSAGGGGQLILCQNGNASIGTNFNSPARLQIAAGSASVPAMALLTQSSYTGVTGGSFWYTSPNFNFLGGLISNSSSTIAAISSSNISSPGALVLNSTVGNPLDLKVNNSTVLDVVGTGVTVTGTVNSSGGFINSSACQFSEIDGVSNNLTYNTKLGNGTHTFGHNLGTLTSVTINTAAITFTPPLNVIGAITSTGNIVTNGLINAGSSVTGSNFNSTATQTVIAGSSTGSATFSQPFKGSSYKKVVIWCNALVGTATYTFQTSFVNTPVVMSTTGPATSVVTSLSTTSVTITGVTTNGFIFIEGY